jgi:prolipoprotein diacylglyceryl transferase
MDLSYIPSPSHGVLYLGPIPLRGYAFCIIIGVFVAVWLGNKRWVARGGRVGTVADIAIWAVPFGLVGGRLYHVITDYELYFSDGRDWVNAFKVWEGGLGIWGAIALGALGAWIGARRRGIPMPAYADAVAPGIAFAQAFGRWGNWFNQELYGRRTDVPWALHITSNADGRVSGYYHPTFLYESLWCIGVGLLVIWADRRFRLGHGRAFALYVAAYCVGRGWIEYMRVDDAHHILGLRLNDWTAITVFLLAVAYFWVSSKMRPGRETEVEPGASASGEGTGAGAVESAAPEAPQPKAAGHKAADQEATGRKATGQKAAGQESPDQEAVGAADDAPGDTEPEADPKDTGGKDAGPKGSAGKDSTVQDATVQDAAVKDEAGSARKA